jgi:hypothetical protein
VSDVFVRRYVRNKCHHQKICQSIYQSDHMYIYSNIYIYVYYVYLYIRIQYIYILYVYIYIAYIHNVCHNECQKIEECQDVLACLSECSCQAQDHTMYFFFHIFSREDIGLFGLDFETQLHLNGSNIFETYHSHSGIALEMDQN